MVNSLVRTSSAWLVLSSRFSVNVLPQQHLEMPLSISVSAWIRGLRAGFKAPATKDLFNEFRVTASDEAGLAKAKCLFPAMINSSRCIRSNDLK